MDRLIELLIFLTGSIAFGIMIGRQSLNQRIKDLNYIAKVKEDELKIYQSRAKRELELSHLSNSEIVSRVANTGRLDEPDDSN